MLPEAAVAVFYVLFRLISLFYLLYSPPLPPSALQASSILNKVSAGFGSVTVLLTILYFLGMESGKLDGGQAHTSLILATAIQ